MANIRAGCTQQKNDLAHLCCIQTCTGSLLPDMKVHAHKITEAVGSC